MSIPLKDDDRWLDIVTELTEQHPIPDDLLRMIEDQIEPDTMNSGIDHGDAMSAIAVAFPLILNYYDRIDLAGEVIRYNAPED